MNALLLDRDLRQKAPVLEQRGTLLSRLAVAPDPRVCPVLPRLGLAQIVPEVVQGVTTLCPRVKRGAMPSGMR